MFKEDISKIGCAPGNPLCLFWEKEFKPYILNSFSPNVYVKLSNEAIGCKTNMLEKEEDNKREDKELDKETSKGMNQSSDDNDDEDKLIKRTGDQVTSMNGNGSSKDKCKEKNKDKENILDQLVFVDYNEIGNNKINNGDNKPSLAKLIFQIDIIISNENNKRMRSNDSSSSLNKDKSNERPIVIDDNSENPSKYTNIINSFPALVSSEYFDEEEVDGKNIIYSSNTSDLEFISINLLIKKICIENCYENNAEIIKGFLQQYPTFLDLHILIDKIINAYMYYKSKTQSVGSITSFLNTIVLKRYDEIKENDDLYSKIQNFYFKIFKSNYLSGIDSSDHLLSSIIFLLEAKRDSFDLEFVKRSFKERKKFGRIALKAQIGRIVHNKFIINFWTDEEIARQLTYISRTMILNISKREIIGARYAKKKKEETSPNILSLIKRFDLLCCFIIEEILSYDNLSERSRVIERWIGVGMKCKEMNNFNDTIIISTAFNNFIVKRLQNTWRKVSTKAINEIEELKKFCTCQGSYISLRNSISQCIEQKKPYVPYLGLLLKEISYYEENMPSIKDDTLINFGKIQKVLKAIKNFFYFSNLPYNYRPLKNLNILNHLNPKTEDELEKMGVGLEPKFTLFSSSRDKHTTNTEESYYNQITKLKIMENSTSNVNNSNTTESKDDLNLQKSHSSLI